MAQFVSIVKEKLAAHPISVAQPIFFFLKVDWIVENVLPNNIHDT